MDLRSQDKWNNIYAKRTAQEPATAAAVLRRYAHWLPSEGLALDYACGRGGNALLLAAAGLETQGWDISKVALLQLEQQAKECALSLSTRETDLTTQQLPSDHFDVISCSYYLEREQMAAICCALKPGGLLFYETFNAMLPSGKGPKNPDFLLRQSELLEQFSKLQILFYEELWDSADSEGNTGVSRLVARRVVDV